MESLLYRNRLFLCGYTFLLVLTLFFLNVYGKDGTFMSINSNHTKVFDYFFWLITYLGDGICYLLLIAVCYFIDRKWFYISLCSFVATTFVVQLLKRLMVEPRPLDHFQDVAHLHLCDWVNVHHTNSFPSGHTASAFSMAFLLVNMVNDKRWGLLILFLAALVGYSRVYLAQHFLSDVSTGSYIGITVTILSIYAVNEHQFNKMRLSI
ncbi:phosphatase PAP2 family protein [Solitalea lacus]|uniref:phosphatase PAP2 family protein n=1 Tax=Solitalea lacus TaxID=2911172 RepID=UPI001EDB29D6|nr:phosphatase PAP2 family protein [Solitalea lacus]UKJ07629.1 phosphatase PAP2 family protein [Solitalea lacus]